MNSDMLMLGFSISGIAIGLTCWLFVYAVYDTWQEDNPPRR